MQERIFNLLFNEDEITWQNIIYDLVNSEEMNPWDVDISLISQKFLQRIKKLKETDFRISGKVVLASAILLKIKSNHLLVHDISALDSLINSQEMDEDAFYDELEGEIEENPKYESKPLVPRTPQPRKRKISVFDLVNALEKAIEVQDRRIINKSKAPAVEIPQKSLDMSVVIKEVYKKVTAFFKKNKNKLTFTQLLPSESKEDKVLTFIPLLHLDNQRKVNLLQEKHFGEIEVKLNKKVIS
ncbi:MAG: segregation/condensation protein A [Candidatus Odinarchaeia archaeon]